MKQRENNRYIKERKDSKGRLLCLIPTCNNLRQKYKTTNNIRHYCKDHTCWDMGEFTSWASLRTKALGRDNRTCVKCGDKREHIETTVKQKRYINFDNFLAGKEKLKYVYQDLKIIVSNLIGDHIIPIALGGDEWDLNNIQTLCLACNKIKTKQDQKNIARARRIEKRLISQTTIFK